LTTRPFDRFAAIVVLASMALAWPVLELLANNAEFFLARAAPRLDVAGVGVALAVILPLGLGLVGLLPGRIGMVATMGLVTILGASLAFLFLRRLGWPEWPTIALSVVAGGALAWAFRRFEGARMAFRYLSPVPLLMLGLYLLASPSGGLVFDTGARPGSAAHPSNPVPLVMIVFDEFPGASLVDADGNLLTERYPNFARLAADGTWFTNAVTVMDHTELSIPAMLTGNVPELSRTPYAGQYPDTLFTLLADSHRMDVLETTTQLCPYSVCTDRAAPPPVGDRLDSLARDISVISGHALLPKLAAESLPQIDGSWGNFGAASADYDPIAVFNEARKTDVRLKLEELADNIAKYRDTSEPAFHFAHALIPHHPWQILPDGRKYLLAAEKTPGSEGTGWGPDPWLTAQAMQRHFLQAEYADTALGEILDAMVESGIYDEAMIVAVADHGIAVYPDVPHQRRITDETVGEIAFVPLFVKAPGHPGGVIDHRRALTIDIVPTVADVMGFELPYEVEGSSLFGPAPDRPETTTTGKDSSATFAGDESPKLAVARRLARWFPTGDPWELRPPGAPDLTGQRVGALATEETRFYFLLDRPQWYDQVDLNDMLPARISGKLIGAGSDEKVLGVAVNGVIGAMTRTYLDGDETEFQAVLPPGLYRQGANDVELVWVQPGDIEEIPRR
jgi:hypothetical protein